MAFRKFRGRGRPRFRRRVRWEQDRVVQCNRVFNVATDAVCCTGSPVGSVTFLDAFPLLTMTIPFTAAPERYPSTLATRKMRFGGMKFQSDWQTNPQEWFQGENCNTNISALAFVLKIWEAIVVLPLAEGSTFAPAYIPELACAAKQAIDQADRVLWKRITMLPMWGFGILEVLPQLEHNQRNTEAGQQVVKVRADVDDRHGIFMVRQFVHDIAEFANGNDIDCFIPVVNEMWGSLFYRAIG